MSRVMTNCSISRARNSEKTLCCDSALGVLMMMLLMTMMALVVVVTMMMSMLMLLIILLVIPDFQACLIICPLPQVAGRCKY